MNSIGLYFYNLKPFGIADLTPPQADQMPSRICYTVWRIAERHLSSTCGNPPKADLRPRQSLNLGKKPTVAKGSVNNSAAFLYGMSIIKIFRFFSNQTIDGIYS